MWTYPTPDGWDTARATYVAFSEAGEPTVSGEHSAFQWTTPAKYIATWCSTEIEDAFPTHARFISEVRMNCELISKMLE